MMLTRRVLLASTAAAFWSPVGVHRPRRRTPARRRSSQTFGNQLVAVVNGDGSLPTRSSASVR